MILFFLIISLIIPRISQAETIQFFGDVLLSRGIQDMIEREGAGSLWKGASRIFSRDAIRVANLEGAIGSRSSCVRGRKICFNIESTALPALDKFDVISLQNNHSLDLGPRERRKTIGKLEKRNLIPLGDNHYSTTITTQNGLIGIIALTDVVNSPQDSKYMIMADSPDAIQEIHRLKNLTGLVAVYVHWGRELDNLPTARMRQLAKDYINAGADIVVGHHPHVTGKTECIDGRPVVYSLGNFLFDQKFEETKKGSVLQCSRSTEGVLTCFLIAVETPMNSFLPHTAKDNSAYNNDNEILASCTPVKPPVWSGVFSKGDAVRSFTLKGVKERAALYSIQQLDSAGYGVIWKSPAMPIEKMQTVDLNGDGVQEVMLIQNIFSTLDNEVGKRVYIYNLDHGLKALWRGSGLSRPLLDAVFAESTEKEKDGPFLIALHSPDSFLVRAPSKNGCILMSYRWNGFGFTGFKEKRFQMKAERLSLSKDKVRLVNGDGSIIAELDFSELN